MDFSSASKYLNSFINYEKVGYNYPRDLKLARVRMVMAQLGVEYTHLPVIHIAGTKGKGSVATIIAYILAASGYRVGLYTSPHFHDFRERIKVLTLTSAGVRVSCISKKDVVEFCVKYKPVLEKMRFTREFGKLSFFEVYTALGFSYFLRQRLDFVVLETGLGGRLDATNVITPFVSVITHIGYDHTSKLGRRLAQIAYEKAGIIKKGIPVVTASQRRSALDVIRKKCKEEKAPMFLYGRDFISSRIRVRPECIFFDFSFGGFSARRLKLSLQGTHQVENASLAIAALRILKDNGIIRQIDFRKGLSAVSLEGRFEIVSRNPLIVFDIAHNVSSFRVLQDSLKTYFPRKKVILIFGASRDKDVKGMLKYINYDKLILTSFSNPRSFSTSELTEQVNDPYALVAQDVRESFKIAYKYYNRGYLILVAGSFFLVADAKGMIKNV